MMANSGSSFWGFEATGPKHSATMRARHAARLQRSLKQDAILV